MSYRDTSQVVFCAKNATNNFSEPREVGYNYLYFYYPIDFNYTKNSYTTLSLSQFQFHHLFYNITDKNNKLIIHSDSNFYQQDVTCQLSLDPGNYTILDICEALTKQLRSYGEEERDEVLKHLMIQWDRDLNRVAFRTNFYMNDYFQRKFHFGLTSTLFSVLGIDDTQQTEEYSDEVYDQNNPYNTNEIFTVFVASIAPRVQSIRRLYIVLNEELNQYVNYSTQSKFFESIPVEGDLNQLITYRPTTIAATKIIPNNYRLNGIMVRIVDEDGNLINMGDDRWSLTLQLDHFRTDVPMFETILGFMASLQKRANKRMLTNESKEKKQKRKKLREIRM